MIRNFAASVIFAVTIVSTSQLTDNAELRLAELAQYDGDWFVAEHRQHIRVVRDSGENWIETYFQSHGICGYFQWSMRMAYDQSADKYSAKIKWSEFRDGFRLHRKLPWEEFELIGQWDSESQTFTWTPSDPTIECTVKTVFHSKNHQKVYFSSDATFDFPTGAYNFYRLW